MNIPDAFGIKRNGATKQESPIPPIPSVVRPRKPSLDEQNVAAVEAALQPDPRPLPNVSDAVVQSFIDMGKNIAAAMRRAGDACLEQGERRKAEYYKAAEVAERKAEFQAREAGEFIDSLASINGAMAPKAVLPAATDRTVGDAATVLAPTVESPAEPEPPKTAA